MLTLAFDTATDVATCALVRDGRVLGERSSRAITVLAGADELLREAGASPGDRDALAGSTCPAPASTRSSPATTGPPSGSSPSTFAHPTRRWSLDARDPQPPAARPVRDRGDRAPRIPDSVVALDVRGRARQALVDLSRR